jgi:predicted O-linked N-acetylglucosamine transferase (SPINDLY family)
MGYRNFIASGAADYIQLALRLGADSAERASASAAILQSCDSLFGDVEAVRELEQYWEEALEQRLASI